MHDRINTVDVFYEVLSIDEETNVIKTIRAAHNMRYFFRPEMEFYLREAGFYNLSWLLEYMKKVMVKNMKKYHCWTDCLYELACEYSEQYIPISFHGIAYHEIFVRNFFGGGIMTGVFLEIRQIGFIRNGIRYRKY